MAGPGCRGSRPGRRRDRERPLHAGGNGPRRKRALRGPARFSDHSAGDGVDHRIRAAALGPELAWRSSRRFDRRWRRAGDRHQDGAGDVPVGRARSRFGAGHLHARADDRLGSARLLSRQLDRRIGRRGPVGLFAQHLGGLPDQRNDGFGDLAARRQEEQLQSRRGGPLRLAARRRVAARRDDQRLR